MIREKTKSHEKKKVALYGRVSGTRQKASGDLNRQLALFKGHAMRKGYRLYKVYSDVGSGLNDKRKGLFLIETFLNSWNVSLELIHPHVVEDTPHSFSYFLEKLKNYIITCAFSFAFHNNHLLQQE
ncbi:MAG: hypothetical protein ACTSU4_01920 [Promethearchaeota archaeon]